MKKIIMLIYILGLCVICLFAQKRANNLQIGTGYAFFREKTMNQYIKRSMISYKLNVYKKYYIKATFSEIGYFQSRGLGLMFLPLPKDPSLWNNFITARAYINVDIVAGYNFITQSERHFLGISGGYNHRWGTESMITDFINWGNDINGKPVYEFHGLGQQVKQHGINFSIDYSLFLTQNKLLSIDNCLSTQVFWKGDPSLCFNTGLGVNF